MMLKRLLIRITLFLIPFAAVLGVVAWIAVTSGEAMPAAVVLDIQARDPDAIYRYRNMNPQRTFVYKLAALRSRPAPNVLMIGSSRVLTFTSGLVEGGRHFYNFGLPSVFLDGVEAIIESLTPETMPDVIILGVDVFWFNAELDRTSAEDRGFNPNDDALARIAPTMRVLVQQLVSGERSLSDTINRRDIFGHGSALGFEAQDTAIGYLWDGSRRSRRDPALEPAVGDPAVTAGRDRSTMGGSRVDEAGFAELDALLTRAEALDVTIVAMLPPYMPQMLEYMATSGKYGFFEPSRARIKALFESHGIPLFDFTDLAQFGVGAEEMRDFVHPTERLSARMFAAMAREIPALRDFADPARIEQAIADSPRPDQIFSP